MAESPQLYRKLLKKQSTCNIGTGQKKSKAYVGTLIHLRVLRDSGIEKKIERMSDMVLFEALLRARRWLSLSGWGGGINLQTLWLVERWVMDKVKTEGCQLELAEDACT